MKTLKKQAVFPVLMLLVVTALASIGSAFAWFSIATNASVDTIEAKASAAGTGIMISADNVTYTYNIDITKCISLNVPKELDTVSTNGEVNGGLLTFFNANVEQINASDTLITSSSAKALTAPAGVITNGIYEEVENEDTAGYIAFDIFFNVIGSKDDVNNEQVKIYLNTGSAVAGKEVTDNAIVNAMRVAFVNEGLAPNQAGVTALTAGTSAVIWQPGTYVANQYGLEAESDEDAETEKPISFNAYKPVAGKAVLVNTYSTDHLVLTNDNEVETWDEDLKTGNKAIATLTEGYNKIRVYIWLEGNDENCVNNISLKNVTIDLAFYSLSA